MTDVKAAEVLLSPQGALPVLQKWFGDVIVDLWDTWPPYEQRWLLTGCPVWGDYVDTLVNWCIPTLLAPENLKALVPCWLVFFTDAPGFARLMQATAQFEQFGVTPIISLIPDEVLAEARKHPSNRYWILGTAHNIMLRMAHRARTGFHMMAPDHLYGQHYVRNLKRLAIEDKHEVIAQTGLSANIEGATRELKNYLHAQGWLAVPDRDLGSIAWRNLHAQTRAYLMNDARIPDRMPHAHFMAWQGRDAIWSYCCHQNAAWLSPAICQRAPNFLPATIDTRLPYFSKEFHVPNVDDEMCFIELSDASKASQTAPVGKDMFLSRCWAQAAFSQRYFPWFMKPSATPIHPQKTFLTDEVIRTQHQAVADLLWAERPPAWMETLQQTPQ